jgi:hypothetical protein
MAKQVFQDGEMRRLARRLEPDAVERLSAAKVQEAEDFRLFRYDTADGKVDIDLYRRLQTEANKMKIENQWVPEEHIQLLSAYLRAMGVQVSRGVCHGTRRGNEQVWFRKHLGAQADVFGTEISDNATEFPHTIQWDFHEVDPDWVGQMELVYSNSWDHAHDPETAFAGWISSLRPGGFLMLDHGWNYQPERVTAMDPFGISEAGLVAMLNRVGAGKGGVVEVIDGGSHKDMPIRTVMFRASL